MKKIEKLQFIENKINIINRKIFQEMPPYYALIGKKSEWDEKIKSWGKQLIF